MAHMHAPLHLVRMLKPHSRRGGADVLQQQVLQYSRCCHNADAATKQVALQSRRCRKQVVPPDRRLEDKLRALLPVYQLMHTLLHGDLSDQAIHWHWLLWPANAVGHRQGLHVPPATTAHSTITTCSQ